MLFSIRLVALVVLSAGAALGETSALARCAIWGDPYLTPFMAEGQDSPVTDACDLPRSPVVLFRNKFIEVRVVNEGSAYGNIIAFSVALFEESESDDDVCTFNEHDFKSVQRSFTCGSASTSIDSSMIIHYPAADLRMVIENRGGHYIVSLYTTSENVKISRGICRNGCPQPKPVSVSLAERICDVYLREFLGSGASVPVTLQSLVQATRQACITDVSVMGSKKYAEEAVANIASALLTSGATSIDQVREKMQEAARMTERIVKLAQQLTAGMLAN